MSALLKAGDAIALAAVRALDVPSQENEAAPLELPNFAGATTLAMPRFDNARSELEAAIEELHQRLADTENEADAREDAAFERGRLEGEDLATGETEKRLELLRKSLEAVQQAHASRLAEYELLALQLARTGLARVFGDDGLRTELVTKAIAHRLASIKRRLVVRIRISPRDFRSDEDLQALVAQASGIEIEQDETLDAGDCVIDLRLGTIDLGLPAQWQRLTAFLENLAEEPEA